VVGRSALGSLLLFLLILTVLSGLGCASELPAGAIAQVGTALVSQDTFDELVAAYVGAGKAPDKDAPGDEYQKFEQAIAEYLVVQEVLRQEASTYKVTVTESDVQAEIDQIKRMFQGSEERLVAALERQNLTLEEFTESLRDSMWLDKMKAAVTKDLTVTEEEAQAYYQAHKAEYVEQESREVRHILISPFATLVDNTVSRTATQAEWEAARTEAEKVRSEILNGADFITEAEKYSDDETTADSGGELGAVVRGQMVPAFDEVVFSLQKGELSEPVRTSYGYHLIEVTDITPEQQVSYEQVKENIKSALLGEKQQNTWDIWLKAKESELGVVYRKGYAPAGATDDEFDYGLLSTTSTTNSSSSSEATGSGDQ
jgi:foldase protein PrsA